MTVRAPMVAILRRFRTATGYLGTELLRSDDGSYDTIDRRRAASELGRFETVPVEDDR